MTITITPITSSQWGDVLKVAVWLAASFVITLVPAYLTKHYLWLAGAPAVNFALYTLAQIFNQDLTQAEGQLPVIVKPEVDQVVSQVESQEPPSDLPTTAIPPTEPVAQG